jgi:glycosyltransferase involved in cell wall biosynthesis
LTAGEHGDRLPRVVVALPVHNGATTLIPAVQSLLSQKGIDLTCVVSENWSTDETPSILARFACGDERLSVVRPDRLRPAPENFLFAFERARACQPQFFTWLGADDELTPDYLARAVGRLTQCPKAEFVVASSQFVATDSSTRSSVRRPSRGLGSSMAFRRLLSYACRRRWNEIYAVYRPSAFDALSLIEDRGGFDVVLTWRLLLRGPAARLDMIGTRYAVRGPRLRPSRVGLRRTVRAAREVQPREYWLRLWRDLFDAAAEAPTANLRRQARAALIVAAVHPNWLRKFGHEVAHRAAYGVGRRRPGSRTRP